MMRAYLVTWQVEVTAENAEEAAVMAMGMQRDPYSLATVFTVRDVGTGEEKSVDAAQIIEGE
jgi:hypothetical protein